MISRIARIFVVTVAMVSVCSCLFAQGQKQDNAGTAQPTKNVQTKEVEGTVSGLSASFIAVVYGRSEEGIAQEMAFTLNDKVRIAHKNSLKDIGVGDSVKVIYEETIEKKQEGSQSSKRAVKQIVFLRQAPKQIEQELKSRPEEPIQAENPQEKLPLRGLKGE